MGTSTLYVPFACTLALNVCTAPSLPVTVKLTVALTGASVVPVIVGVASLLLSGASTVKFGACVSTLPVSLALASLPTSSATVAATV